GWVRLKGDRGAILSKMEDGPSLRGFDLYYADGKLLAHLIHQWPENALRVQTKDPVPRDTWFHALATYDGSGKAAGLKIYLNGESRPLDVLDDKLSSTITNPVPLHLGARFNSDFLKADLDEIRVYGRALDADEVAVLVAAPVRQIVSIPVTERTTEQQNELRYYVRRHRMPALQSAEQELAKRRKAREEFEKTIPTTMVMQELEKPRDTFMLVRGQYDKPGDKVTPGIPVAFGTLADGAPANRLGLA